MVKVVVNWDVQEEPVANAETEDHFVITLGVLEAVKPLTSRSHTFIAVEPGSYQGALSNVDASGKELAPPALFSVVVPAAATASIPVNVTSQLQ